MIHPAQHSARLDAIPNVRHGFFGRQGGISPGAFASLNIGYGLGDDDSNVSTNLQSIARYMRVEPRRMARIEQVHSARLIVVNEENLADLAQQRADALLTRGASIALCIRTADCVPLLFADRNAQVIAAAHAGWRGLAGGIIGVTLKAMLDQGAALRDIRVAIGPHIGACCYEVGPEVCAALGEGSCQQRSGRIYADQATVAQAQLQKAGLTADQLELCNPCASCEAEIYFSHRRDQGITGRQLSVIVRA